MEKNSQNKFENESQYAELAALFKTFADETRLKIMFAISEKELCAGINYYFECIIVTGFSSDENTKIHEVSETKT